MSELTAASLPASTLTRRRIYRLVPAARGHRLASGEEPSPELGLRDVLVRIAAASLNYRDWLIRDGQLGEVRDGLIPVSDGAGTVVSSGSAVTRWRKGDRVATAFYPTWTGGPYQESYGSLARGGGHSDGILTDLIAAPEDSLVRIPEPLNAEEAATLPCAALTAWQALVVRGKVKAGDTILIQGTGGVAIYALQFAKALGARAIVLSSSDAKCERARQLGAWETLNYRTTPDWDFEVRKLTGGRGVSHVIELGGPDTYDRSLRALAAGGKIAQIGVFTGLGPRSNLFRLQLINADINGINVGSRDQFDAMNTFIASHGIRPVIDRSFAFEEAEAAYDYLASGQHFGKIVIKLESDLPAAPMRQGSPTANIP